MNQRLEELEVIIIDDASSDCSYQIAMEYYQKYTDKIKLIRNEKNLGQGASRNRGLEIARGEYIGFVDSDDYVSLSMYEELYHKAITYYYPDIISTKLIFVKKEEYFNQDLSYARANNDYVYKPLTDSKFILEESPSSCNKLFKRSFIQDSIFLETSLWEDFAFTYTCLLNASRVLVNQSPNYFYRKRCKDSVSAQGFSLNYHIRDCFLVADEIEKRTKSTGRFLALENEIRFLQSVICLERVSEILNWDIDEEKKKFLCLSISDMVKEKYSDWEKLDVEELYTRVGYLEIERLREFISNRSTIVGFEMNCNDKIIKKKLNK